MADIDGPDGPARDAGLRNIAALLRLPNTARFFASRMFASVGLWSEQLATGWLVWELTGSAAWLGFFAFLRLGPSVVAGPLGGVLTDRVHPLRVMRACKAGIVAGFVLLVALLAAGRLGLAALAILVFWIGTLQALSNPSNKAIIWQLVPRGWLPVAIPVGSTTFNVAAFVGPALAGFLIAEAGVLAAYAVTLVLQGRFLALLLVLRLDVRPAEDDLRRAQRGIGIARSLIDGARYAGADAPMRAVLGLHLVFSVCARPLIALMPAIAALIFGGGADTMGLLTACIGGGAILGGVWLARRGRAAGLSRILLICMTGLMLALGWLAAGPAPILGFVLLGGMGWCMIVRAAGTQTLIQFAVAQEMRGRMMGIYGLFLRAGSALGALLIGVAADLTSMQVALGTAAGIGLAVLALTARGFLEGGRAAEVRAM